MYDLADCIRPDEKERFSMPGVPVDPELRKDLKGSMFDFDLEQSNIDCPKDLRWLLEIAENKRSHFPNLKRVGLMERCGMLRSGMHPRNWTLPLAIQDAFDAADITFRAVMRVTTAAPTFD